MPFLGGLFYLLPLQKQESSTPRVSLEGVPFKGKEDRSHGNGCLRLSLSLIPVPGYPFRKRWHFSGFLKGGRCLRSPDQVFEGERGSNRHDCSGGRFRKASEALEERVSRGGDLKGGRYLNGERSLSDQGLFHDRSSF